MKKRYIILFLVIIFAIVAFILATSATGPTPPLDQDTAPAVTDQSPAPLPKNDLAPQAAPAEDNPLITVMSPKPNDFVTSPLTVVGKARGNWFFEGSFPVTLTDWDGKIIAEGHATAQGEWMTTDFVPYVATLTFTAPKAPSTRGYLILKKDNPSGEARFDDSIELPVNF